MINNPKGTYRIAYMMPLFGEQTWTEFSRSMIDTFGSDKKFLDEVAANLGSFGKVGSSEQYYNTIFNITEELKNHSMAEVRKWVRNCVIHYNKRIRCEKLEEENRR